MYTITLRHNMEMAHRLSHDDSPIKCQSIHGHSWWATVTIAGAAVDHAGMLVEFGAFKKAWRAFLDDHLDHHLVVRRGDPVALAIHEVQPDARIQWLDVDPTTENLAKWIFEQSQRILQEVAPDKGVHIQRLHLKETEVNAAAYEAS